MNLKRKNAVNTLAGIVDSIENDKLKHDVMSLEQLSEAFLNEHDPDEQNKIAEDYKQQHEKLHKFIADNPELVNAEVERALLSAALGGEYVDEEVRINSNGKRTYKRTKKHIAPNASAALSYLQNKDKENWSPNPKADPELEDTSEIEEEVYGEKPKT
ncbi:MAG: hypothetical protein ACI4RC_04220 [Oscillospiraceae bacterium]